MRVNICKFTITAIKIMWEDTALQGGGESRTHNQFLHVVISIENYLIFEITPSSKRILYYSKYEFIQAL